MKSDTFKQVLSLQEEIRDSADYTIFMAIKENATSVMLFLRNHRELKRILDVIEDPANATKLRSAKERRSLKLVLYETTHLLHNYIASVMSLVDHTRRLHKNLYEKDYPDRLEIIQAEIDRRFKNNGTHQVIQGLRDYTLHRKLPGVGRSTYYAASDKNLETKYVISTISLLEWDEWKPQAKTILKNSENIHINQLISDHHNNIVSFYRWLGQKQKTWHKKGKQNLRAKMDNLQQIRQSGL